MTFNEQGTTFYGDRPEDVVRTVEAWDVAVVGANCSQGPQPMLGTVGGKGAGGGGVGGATCSQGPQPMLETVERMAAAATRVKLSAMPNAGAPALVDGRYVYLCPPADMAAYPRRSITAA